MAKRLRRLYIEQARRNAPSERDGCAVELMCVAELSCVGALGCHERQKGATIAMSTEKKQNLQDTFLNSVRKSKTPLTIFLVNGVKLQGVVSWFDNFCVLLRRDGQSPAGLQARHLHHHARAAGPALRAGADEDDD